jgi:hypothetical protein
MIMKSVLNFIFIVCLSIPAYGKLQATGFPGTVEDLSFAARVELASDGYVPFLDKKAYEELNIVPGEEFYTDHMIAQQLAEIEQQKQDAQTMNQTEYCKKYPTDASKCPQTAQTTQTTTAQTTPAEQQKPWTGKTIGGGPVTENNIVTGGSCYPANKVHTGLSNKIMTSGRYEKIPAFEKGLMTVFRKEGTCGTLANDRCGYTCYGIGSSPKCAGVVVKSRTEAEDWYYQNIWVKYNIGQLPDVISTDYFLAAMGSGPVTAYNQFTSFLGIPRNKSKKVDSAMIKAVNNYQGDIHNRWLDKRDVFLQAVARKTYKGTINKGYKNAIDIKRKNGCHVRPSEPIYR